MKSTIIISAVCLISNLAVAQTPVYQSSLNNTGGTQNNIMFDAIPDVAGNVYFCGSRADVFTIGGATLNTGIGGVYFGKATPSGTIAWLKGGGTNMATQDVAYDIVLDQNNNIYVCGGVGMLSTASFDGVSMAFANPGFVVKMDSNGNVLWVEGFSAAVHGMTINRNNAPVINIGSSSIAILNSSNGAIANSVSFSGDLQSPYRHNVEVDANNNIFVQLGSKVIKFDDALNQLWSTPITFSLAETFKLNLDDAGNVYSSFYALFGTVTVGTISKSNFPNGYIYKLDNATGQPLLVDSVLIAGANSKIREVIPDNLGNYYIIGDGAFNTPHILKMTTGYSVAWDRAMDNNAGLYETNLISENCVVACGKHSDDLVLDATTLVLPAGSSGIDNSFMTYLCDGSVGINGNDLQTENGNIYPNPADNRIHYNLEGVVSISLLDVCGKVLSFSTDLSGDLDVSGINSGIYFLTMKKEDGTNHSLRFVKK